MTTTQEQGPSQNSHQRDGFEIVIRGSDGVWGNEVGDANVFDSFGEAEDGIQQLRTLDEEWASADLNVRPIDRTPKLSVINGVTHA